MRDQNFLKNVRGDDVYFTRPKIGKFAGTVVVSSPDVCKLIFTVSGKKSLFYTIFAARCSQRLTGNRCNGHTDCPRNVTLHIPLSFILTCLIEALPYLPIVFVFGVVVVRVSSG